MDKWSYIVAISKQYGGDALLDLMDRYGRHNTAEVTLDEARAFYLEKTGGNDLCSTKAAKAELPKTLPK